MLSETNPFKGKRYAVKFGLIVRVFKGLSSDSKKQLGGNLPDTEELIPPERNKQIVLRHFCPSL
jgi:hypothetical protein